MNLFAIRLSVGITLLLPLAALAEDVPNPRVDEPVVPGLNTSVDHTNTGLVFGATGSGTAASVPDPGPSAAPVASPATGGQGGVAVGLRHYRLRLDPPVAGAPGVIRAEDAQVVGTFGVGSNGFTVGADGHASGGIGLTSYGQGGCGVYGMVTGQGDLHLEYNSPTGQRATISPGIEAGFGCTTADALSFTVGATGGGRFGLHPDGGVAALPVGAVARLGLDNRFFLTVAGDHTVATTGEGATTDLRAQADVRVGDQWMLSGWVTTRVTKNDDAHGGATLVAPAGFAGATVAF